MTPLGTWVCHFLSNNEYLLSHMVPRRQPSMTGLAMQLWFGALIKSAVKILVRLQSPEALTGAGGPVSRWLMHDVLIDSDRVQLLSTGTSPWTLQCLPDVSTSNPRKSSVSLHSVWSFFYSQSQKIFYFTFVFERHFLWVRLAYSPFSALKMPFDCLLVFKSSAGNQLSDTFL